VQQLAGYKMLRELAFGATNELLPLPNDMNQLPATAGVAFPATRQALLQAGHGFSGIFVQVCVPSQILILFSSIADPPNLLGSATNKKS
jgi:hypothetical protein